MDILDAFFLVTAFTYLFAIPMPVKFLKNVRHNLQRVMWFIAFMIWLVCTLFINFQVQWIILSIIYTVAGLLSYLEIADWGSRPHNLFMAAWDLLLAVSCLIKV